MPSLVAECPLPSTGEGQHALKFFWTQPWVGAKFLTNKFPSLPGPARRKRFLDFKRLWKELNTAELNCVYLKLVIS